MSAGQQQLDSLKGAGFTDSELSAYQADHTKTLLDAGFSQQEVASYWGQQPFDDSGLKQHFKQGLGTVKGEEGKPLSFGDYLDAGWQMSVTGLIKRHKLPDTLAPQDAPMWGRIAQNVAQVAGDLPAMLGGAFLGREAGTVVGGVVGSPGGLTGIATGAKVGGALGTGYGAFAVPAAIRKSLMDNYQKGAIKDAADFWARASSTFIEANKQGLVGAATAGAGGLVGKLAAPVMSPLLAGTAQTAAEITTMVTAGKAMEGQLPNWQDFADAAVLVGGLHLATGGASVLSGQVNRLRGKLSENYVATGIKPDEVVADAQADPTVRQDIASDNVPIPKAYESAVDPAAKPPEPTPVKVPAEMRSQSMGMEGSVQNDVAIKPAELSESADALSTAQKNNTFTGQAKGAGSSVGMTQPAGTPAEKLFSNFADEKKPANLSEEAWAARQDDFRAQMLSRAKSERGFEPYNKPITNTYEFDGNVKADVTATTQGRSLTRIVLRDGDKVVGAAKIDRGMIDSIAIDKAYKGGQYGEKLLSWLKDKKLANVAEVPDRTPGFVAIQKKVIAGTAAEPKPAEPADAVEKWSFHGQRLWEMSPAELQKAAESPDQAASEDSLLATPHEIDVISQGVSAVADAQTPKELSQVLKTSVINLGTKVDPSQMDLSELRSFMELKTGLQRAHEQGWDVAQISADTLTLAGREFSSPENAREVLGQFLENRSDRTESAQGKISSGVPPRLPPPATGSPASENEPNAREQILARLSQTEPKSGVKVTLDKVYTALVDDLHPVKQLTRLLAGEKPLEVADDPYQLARLTRGSTGKADHFLEFSPFKFDTLENVGKPLTKILEPLKEDLDGLRAYAVSKRALELEARGVKTGVPLEAAQTTVAKGGKYAKAFQELKDYQTHTLEYLRDSGILGKDAFEAMKEANQDYVPFYRLMDESEGVSGAKSAGKGLSVRAPVKKIEGSTRKIVDPLESIIKNTYLYVQLAERNRALSTLADLADAAGERGAELMRRVESSFKKDSVASGFAKENGVEVAPETLSVFRPRAPGLRNDEIALYRDGERQVFQVSPEVATAVRALDQQSVGLAVKIMRAPASWMRAGTTLAPDFVARNFIRDQLTAFNLGEKGITPVVDAIRGLGSLFKKDENYQAFLKSGGANSAMVAIDRHYIEQNIFKLEKDTGLASKAWNVIKSPLEILRVTSEIIENSTRLGEFKRQTQGETGADTIMQGGMAAREVTLDFQRVGAQTRALNMIVAFWNAHVQGLDKTARAFLDRPAQTAFKLAASVTLPSVLLWYANNEDPRWAEIPRWQKDLFWIVMTKDHIYRIPKPSELGILFGSLPERILEAYKGENPKAFKDLGGSLGQALAPAYIPSFMVPIVEQFANRSTFTGNPIVPQSMEGILPEYQYTDYTTESAKLLGKFATVMPGFKDSSLSSPAVIENYVRAWSGQLGQYALKLADQALIESGAIPDPVKPAATLADIPAVKAFVIRYPSAGAQSIQDFYDAYDKTNTRINTIKYLAKSGDFQAAMDVMKVAQSENDLFRLQGIKEALATQTKYLRLVSKNPDIKPDEKRQLIDGVYYMMIQAAHQGNQIMDGMNAQLKERGISQVMPPPTTLNPSPSQPRLAQ